MELNQVLIWLATGGAVAAISFMCEKWGLFQSLNATQKRFAMWASASVLGMAALAVTMYVPAETLAEIAKFAKVVITSFSLIFLQEVFHSVTKAKPAG